MVADVGERGFVAADANHCFDAVGRGDEFGDHVPKFIEGVAWPCQSR